MALINCPECGYDTLSENAYVCPCCGSYVNDFLTNDEMFKKSKYEYKVLYIFSFLLPPIGLLAFVTLFSKPDYYRRNVGDYCIFLSCLSSVFYGIIYFLTTLSW